MSHFTTVLLVFLTLSFNVAGNILLKIGVNRMTETSAFGTSVNYLGYLNAPLVMGAGAFASGLLLYIAVLSKIPLNLAQTVFSLQFVTVIIMANLLLAEPISLLRWLGIGIIFVGLIVVALSAR